MEEDLIFRITDFAILFDLSTGAEKKGKEKINSEVMDAQEHASLSVGQY